MYKFGDYNPNYVEIVLLSSFTYQKHIKLTITFLIITPQKIIGNFTAKYLKQKTVILDKTQLKACQKKNAIIVAPSINIF